MVYQNVFYRASFGCWTIVAALQDAGWRPGKYLRKEIHLWWHQRNYLSRHKFNRVAETGKAELLQYLGRLASAAAVSIGDSDSKHTGCADPKVGAVTPLDHKKDGVPLTSTKSISNTASADSQSSKSPMISKTGVSARMKAYSSSAVQPYWSVTVTAYTPDAPITIVFDVSPVLQV
ncbi:MAG: hypothetical protein IPN60_10965 [Saprospiraceae bacterium]|nr:hypothetical protein [Candidatus Opimibacter skivensis]